MKLLSRLVWSEGMHLGPHQFQAQSRYFEDSISFITSALWLDSYGLTGITLDEDALKNGIVSLLFARGTFNDGLAFDLPACDAPPETRNIGDLFPPTRDRLTVSLVIPERLPQGPNVSLTGDANGARYSAEGKVFFDETTGMDERQVSVGRKRLRLILDTEPSSGLISLPIAQIMRSGDGGFIYDPNLIPPCLNISSSERLMLLLRRLIEIMEEKSTSLASSGAGKTASDFSSRTIANFWLLHAVNSGLAPLRHLWVTKRGHPMELFLELSRIAGALCTFSLNSHPNSLPTYDHLALAACFDVLDRHIRDHLEFIIPTNCITIPLKKVADFFYEGQIMDDRCIGRSRWVLGVRSTSNESELVSRTPKLVKICSAKFVGELVRRALPGLELTHLPVPPNAITTTVESQYFGISRSGPFWDHIVQTKQVGIYIPGDIPGATLELQIVLD